MEIRDDNGTVLGNTNSAVYAYRRHINEGCEIYSYPIGIVSTGLLGLWAIWELEEAIDVLEHPIPTDEKIAQMSLTEIWTDNKPNYYTFIEERDSSTIIVITKSHSVVGYPLRGGKDGNTKSWQYTRGQVYSCYFGSPDRIGEYTLMS